ncbi:uncharacterized protein LOC117648374 [Thrips palmi]|uniref:Uncharacterized protein LOC117648374 n=1 Tax=Thrips palmi TaxID=161013 RepID=A0A6P8Z8V5_THRPL|nr:uncharacterized protein LOC117648374 [Thrips palmi]
MALYFLDFRTSAMEPKRRNGSCLPVVERGCCCDLKTCCLFQGWLVVIGSTTSILWSLWNLFILSNACNQVAKWVLERNGPNVTCFMSEDVQKEEDMPDFEIATIFARGSIAIDLVVVSAFLATAALFLKGIYKNEPAKMVHFVRILWVKLVLGTIAVVLVAVMITPMALAGFAYLGYVLYCLICANSLRIHMETKYVPFYSTENLMQPPTLQSAKLRF